MEGPGVKDIADRLQIAVNERVVDVSGNTKAAKERLKGTRIVAIYSVGKRLVIQAETAAVVVHFLMFGTYRVNERRPDKVPRLSLRLGEGEINFYNCSTQVWPLEDLRQLDPTADILNPAFDVERTTAAVKRNEQMIADVLLDQKVFGGVGNIIKCETLHRARIQPQSISRNLPGETARKLIHETVGFAELFYDRKKAGKWLDEYLLVYHKGKCGSCGGKITAKKMGETKRMTFFCPMCQILY
jgi:endonuclease VIII